MINTNKFLRIAQWNANGLQNHKEELIIFLKQNYIDIVLISETHFTYKTTAAYQVTNYATLPIQTEQHTEAQQFFI
jgi:exonuclease III